MGCLKMATGLKSNLGQKNGFNHVQAFSQIGATLEQVIGNSRELVITSSGIWRSYKFNRISCSSL